MIKKLFVIAVIFFIACLIRVQASGPVNLSCSWPNCQKKGKVTDGDLLVQWYKNGEVVNVHAFHVIEKHSPMAFKK